MNELLKERKFRLNVETMAHPDEGKLGDEQFWTLAMETRAKKTQTQREIIGKVQGFFYRCSTEHQLQTEFNEFNRNKVWYEKL